MSGKKFFTRSNFFYALYLFVFLVVALEIFGRIYLAYVLKKSSKPKFVFDYGTVYKHKPGFKEGDGTKNWIEINNQGFRRSTDIEKEKPADVYRIFLLGGSAAHGISSAPPYPVVHIFMNETIDAYLENYFKKKYPGKKIEVVNAAVTGYQVFQHTNYILSELLDYRPDMIVFFDGANDHYFNNPEYNYYKDNKYQFWKPRLQNPSLTGIFDYTFLWLSQYSGFARGYFAWKLNRDATINEKKFQVNTKFTTAQDAISKHKVAAKKGFLRAVETNLQILNSNNVKALLALQPMLVLRKKEVMSAAEKSFTHTDVFCTTLYPTVVAELDSISKKYDAAFVDLNPVFNNSEFSGKQLLIDYCHLSAEGGRVTANALAPLVDSIMISKPKFEK